MEDKNRDTKIKVKNNTKTFHDLTERFKTVVLEAVGEGTKKRSRKKVKAKAPAPHSKAEIAAARQRDRDNFSRITAVAFMVLITAIFIAGFIIKDNNFSADENRLLQERPGFSIPEYMEGRFERKLENYVADQFPMRNTFIRIKSALDMTAGRLETNGVYRCRDNYLMEAITVPDRNDLSATVDAMAQFKNRHSRMNMYFMLVPNAANILGDKLPATVKMADQNKYMDSFYSSISGAGYIPIDVREALTEKSEDTQIYYKTDHHWTTDGAYIAYRTACEIIEIEDDREYKPYAVKNDFNGTLYSRSGYTNGKSDAINIYLPADEKEHVESVMYYADTKEKTTRFYRLENLDTKDAYSVFGGSNHPMYTIKTPVESKRRLLLVKDSYANSFIPFIAQDYREIVVVDPRYFFENIDNLISAEGVTEVLFLYNANTFFGDDSLQLTLGDSPTGDSDQ